MERVIFRTEYDPYKKHTNYLAVFPDDPARPGYLSGVPFEICKDIFGAEYYIFEAFCDMSIGYYYDKTRLVHKNSDDAKRCLEAIRSRFGGEYRVMEKIMYRGSKSNVQPLV